MGNKKIYEEMILETFIPGLAFSCALNDIVLSASEDVLFSLQVASEGTYTEILKERYTPDNDGMIYILDLQKIMEDYLEESPVKNFKFVFTTDGTPTEYISRVIVSRSEINVDAMPFVGQRFLTLMTGTKSTRQKSLEYLSVYSHQAEEVKITAKYRTDSGTYEDTVFAGETTTADSILTMDVSPSKYVQDGKTLVKYSVVCGERIMKYEIDNLSPESPLELLFVNNFGVPETFAMCGTLARESKFTGEYGTVRGEYKRYLIAYDKEHTANTGIMDQPTADWLEDDLLMSYQTFVVKDRTAWKQITIIDQTIKRNTDKAEQPSYELKYVFARRQEGIRDFAGYMARLFDPTFDKTFN